MKLILGTVQLGVDYGIHKQKPSLEIVLILLSTEFITFKNKMTAQETQPNLYPFYLGRFCTYSNIIEPV